MSTRLEGNRWWENYLVRYLMPSIAGTVIVAFLSYCAGSDFSNLLFLPASGKLLDATSLTLLFLYGNLFCYVASYPILLFHATRVRDFWPNGWPASPALDGYIVTPGLLVAICLLPLLPHGECRYWMAFIITIIFVAMQLFRLNVLRTDQHNEKSFGKPVSLVFWYAYRIARRRGDHLVTKTATATFEDTKHTPPPNKICNSRATEQQIDWHGEFIETYRHLREHGNSAFIFVLELALAALTFCVVSRPSSTPARRLGAVGMLFLIWALPAMYVHLLAQHLEFRFSQFELRFGEPVVPGTPDDPTPSAPDTQGEG